MERRYQENKPQEGQCQSYVRQDSQLVECTSKGVRRIDRGLDSGIHCDSCWEQLIAECRSKSG
ncbi:MAG: hypothetical protein KKB21_00440 [Nanoarchaeota archaeon]|nr:hypothetical protein [Nanoarchaeota archaeon]MBU4086023.1 hypothetical protein [Nanoarchaeota archaeon]